MRSASISAFALCAALPLVAACSENAGSPITTGTGGHSPDAGSPDAGENSPLGDVPGLPIDSTISLSDLSERGRGA